jgi:transposase-like protein
VDTVMPRMQAHGTLLDRELRDLRHHLGAIPRGRGRRFPAALRERVIAWTAARRTRGAGWRELARELGVPAGTLQRWLTPRPERAPPVALRPVAVTDEPARQPLTIVAPSGLRLEGVTIADVIAILRGLA